MGRSTSGNGRRRVGICEELQNIWKDEIDPIFDERVKTGARQGVHPASARRRQHRVVITEIMSGVLFPLKYVETACVCHAQR